MNAITVKLHIPKFVDFDYLFTCFCIQLVMGHVLKWYYGTLKKTLSIKDVISEHVVLYFVYV